MSPRPLALLAGLLALCASAATLATEGAQPPGKPWIEVYPVSAYGGHNQNWDATQGADGLLYVAGGSSLLVFDGVSWRQYATPDNGRIRSFHVADDGRVWVGSERDFGWFERGADGGLVWQSLAERLPDAARSFGDVRQVVVVGEAVWFLATERLFRWDGDALDWADPWDGRFRIAFEAGGRLQLLAGDHFYELDDLPSDSATLERDATWRIEAGLPVTAIQLRGDGRLLLGIYDRGLFLLSGDELVPFADAPALAAAWPYVLEPMPDGNLAVGTINDGVFILADDGRILDHFDADFGLPGDTVLGLAIDHQGGLWLTQESYITRLDLGSPLRIVGREFELTDLQGFDRRDDGYWVLAGDGGLATWREGDRAARPVSSPLTEVFGVLATPQGLLAAGARGVHRLELDLAAGETVAAELLFEDSFSYLLVPSTTRPVVYVGTTLGLAVLVLEDGAWRSLGLVSGVDQRADTIAEDADDRVWVGTGSGVVHALAWTPAGELEHVLTLDGDDGVPPGNAWVFPRGDGAILFATTDGGYLLAADGRRLEPDPAFGNEQFGATRDVFRFRALPNGDAVAVIGASDGALWHGRRDSDGVLRWEHGSFAHLDPGYVPFLAVGPNATLWFAIHPQAFRVPLAALEAPAHPVSRLHLRRMGYADQAWLFEGLGPDRVPATLPFEAEALRFEYALASFIEPTATEYRVRLRGLGDEWSSWSRETRRDYTNLPGRDYRFEVQARDVRGVVSEVTSIAFAVAPPWYFAPTALAAYGLAAIVLLLAAAQLGHRVRARRMLAEQRRLEGEVARRTVEVRAKAREIEAMSEARARFFANVSHEFRTPLTLTRGPLRELVEGRAGTLDAAAREYVAMALRNTEAMESLIGQVLDINRLEVGRMPFRPARGDLAEAVRRVADRFRLEAERRNLALTVAGCDDPVLADFDADQLDTILSNLLSNALKYTPAGGVISVDLSQHDRQVALAVADTGPGIPGDDPDRVFERYVQGEVADPSRPGTGIGLALVKELTELHEGSVTLETMPGKGTTFTVTFPVEAEKAALEQETGSGSFAGNEVEPRPISALAEPEDTPTLLVVDDNAELRAFLRLRLQANYRIVEAEDGEAGLARARAELPDAIISDVMMPKLDGMAMTAALKADPETDFIPVLLLTAKDTKRDVVAGLEQGADDYLGKPFDTAELATRVAGLIASRRRLRERLAELEPGESPSVRASFLDRARAIVREHISESDFGINDWADLLHMDRTTLYRKLKAEAGETPEAYLREARLELAARLLRRGAGNVGEVADAVGFASLSHFSRRFKARFGQTPAAWRRAAP